MPKDKNKDSAPAQPEVATVADLSEEALNAKAKKIIEHLDAIDAVLEDAAELTDEALGQWDGTLADSVDAVLHADRQARQVTDRIIARRR